MPNICFVPGCNTGLPKDRNLYKIEGKKYPSVFHPPENMIDEWNTKIPRSDRDLHKNDVVCELHFSSKDIKKCKEYEDEKGNIINFPLSKPILLPHSIPCIFPNLPSYFTKPDLKKRKPPVQREPLLKKNKIYSNVAIDEIIKTPKLNEDVSGEMHTHLNESENVYSIYLDAKKVELPGPMWGFHTDGVKQLIFTHIEDLLNDKCVQIISSTIAKVFIRGKDMNIEYSFNTRSDIEDLLKKIENLKMCPGFNFKNSILWSHKCILYIEGKNVRCRYCSNQNKNVNRKKEKNSNKLANRRAQHTRRLSKKVKIMKSTIVNMKNEFSKVKEETVDNMIKTMPPKQQEVVKMCFKACLAQSKHGLRYTNNWVYECILMKIKSPALYQKMCREKILPLPTPNTLRRYIQKLRPAYGFQQSTFQMLKEKASKIPELERNGCLLLDEMSLSPSVNFNKSTLCVDGLVDLGKFTPENQKIVMGDHALVLMYQPYQGSWIQSIGAFLSKGAAPYQVLEKLIIEATIFLEESGYKVHNIVTDGGPWNRAMWNSFGVTDTNVFCQHPSDPERKLWFTSDFPHLVKTMWTRILKNKTLMTPDGLVQFDHWKYLVEHDELKDIKLCYKLTNDHLYPQHYQKMNVKMAMVFFSKTVADCMEELMIRGEKKFIDCKPTINFIRRIDSLVDIMNSNTEKYGLQADKNAYSNRVLTDFVSYLKAWEIKSPDKQFRFTSQNEKGLIVSINSTLELINYLSENESYKYLMTKRINQDKLEHFFGMVRQACGSNQHPDPKQFVQIYRLLSCYSLIKPPRGSNVAGGEILKTLLDIEINHDENMQKKADLELKLDNILDNGGFEVLSDHLYCEKIDKLNIDSSALTYFVGYVARNAKKHSFPKNCTACFDSIISKNVVTDDNERIVNLRSKGHLLIPSEILMKLVYSLETTIINVLQNNEIKRDILEFVMEGVSLHGIGSKVGCVEHQNELTKYIVKFYLNTRMIFTCKKYNNRVSDRKKKEKLLKKKSRIL